MTQNVFITGGSSGIGKALAYMYAAQGAKVTIAGRSEERLRETCLACVYGDIDWISLDVSDAVAVDVVARDYLRENGTPDILVNSAGVMNPGEFLAISKQDFEENIEVDFTGTANVCRSFASAMVEQGRGTIVNVASVAGFLGIYGYTSYSAAKFAVMGFSEALRFELAPLGLNVCVVCPPDTDTPGYRIEKLRRPKETALIAEKIRIMSPEDVAEEIYKGIEKKKDLIIIGKRSKLFFRLKGLFPELFNLIVSRDVKKAQHGQTK